MTLPRLTDEQRVAVEAAGSVAVTAGAGTGKTHMLTERYVHHLVRDGLRPLEIVAATFTDRAAAELRSRIRGRLRQLGHADLAIEVEAAQIGTLHALAARICREHPEAAGVPFDFVLQDEIEQRLWIDRELRATLAALPEGVGRSAPFSVLEPALRALLADPFTAERALAVPAEAWPALLDGERRRLYRQISAEAAWGEAVAVLRAHGAGPDGRDDKMELQRTAAVAALDRFAKHDFAPEACRALDDLKANRGSKKIWGDAALEALKSACVTIRERYRKASWAFEAELGPADEILREAQDEIRCAYRAARCRLADAKRESRALDFNDLELHALRALERASVRAFYAERWKAFLIDEFQDTNPVQAELLERLVGHATLTVVGDEKQSIYGFRRADVRVFRTVRERIRETGGRVVELSKSFRTHAPLVDALNEIVRPALADLHQPLEAARREAPSGPPHVEVMVIEDADPPKSYRQRAEAHRVGGAIAELLESGHRVHDKTTGASRPVRPEDVAILTRTWSSLETYAADLAARGIPTLHAGGGDLLAQREAKDGGALLSFLVDPLDDLALAAVLRSPFFAVSDVELETFAGAVRAARPTRRSPERTAAPGAAPDRTAAHSSPERRTQPLAAASDSGGGFDPALDAYADDESDELAPFVLRRASRASWWPVLAPLATGDAAAGSPLPLAATVLGELLADARRAPPSALLRRADALTGYTAAILDLPGGPRRLADWKGFVDLVERLEGAAAGSFGVVRQLRQLRDADGVDVPRPAMEGGNAVALMTVHGAKGLEWPVVVLPDLTYRGPGRRASVLFEEDAGVAFEVRDPHGEKVEPVLFRLLAERAKERERQEDVRVLYVALTRARDRLVLSASDRSGGALEHIQEGLEAAGVDPEVVPYSPSDAVPRPPRRQRIDRSGEWMLEPVGPGVVELPVTSLSTYAICPKRFAFDVLDGHPGVAPGARAGDAYGVATARFGVAATSGPGGGRAESGATGGPDHQAAGQPGPAIARAIGTLAHKALQLHIRDPERLARFAPDLPHGAVERAHRLAQSFRSHPAFDAVRDRIADREVRMASRIEGVRLDGVIDAVGDGFVLDYKTGDPVASEAHELQVAVYAAWAQAPRGYLAYLRGPEDGEPPALRELGPGELSEARARAVQIVTRIRSGDLRADPAPAKCRTCPFESICEASLGR